MNDSTGPPGDVLVLVADAPAARRTVEHAADRIAPDARLHLLGLGSGDSSVDAPLLDDARGWAARARRARDHEGRVTTAGRVVETRWPTAADVAGVVAAYVRGHGVERVVIPADVERAISGCSASGLVSALRDADVTDVSVGPEPTTVVHRRLLVAGSLASTGTLFVLALGLYLLLAGRLDAFEVVTGIATATVVAAVFGRVTFARPPALGRSVGRALRGCLYVPYLLWEVAKANVAIAAIVLHPRLPIDPKLVSYRTSLDGELALTTLANSVTLTPGTLTVDVDADSGELLVHTLTEGTRADLLEGSLERAVQFVFGDGEARDDAARLPTAAEEVSDD
jgi:multicomponent Na+:H+ antiporter subunit E